MSRPHANESVFRALADPTRRKLIEILLKGERTAVEMAEAARITSQTLSHHLGVLRTAGVIRQQRKGKYRVYQIIFEPLRGAAAWFRVLDTTIGRERS